MPDRLTQRLSRHFRNGRDALLRAAIDAAHPGTGGMRVLDIGGRQNYWERFGFAWLADRGIAITLQNLSEAEMQTVAGAPAGLFTFSLGDGRHIEAADAAYDLVHSNSVIEHVGLWPDMLAFAQETRRVGRGYYVQTPNFAFPVDPHFWRMPMFHWMPRSVRSALVCALPLATAGRARDAAEAQRFVASSRLLTRRQMATLFPEAELHAERLAMLAKSWTAIYTPLPANRSQDHG